MLRSAAGAANTSEASTAAMASASARAVSVPGLVTSMSGTTEAIPSAGPKRANGAKAATRRSSARDAEGVAHEVALRLELRVPVDDALGRAGGAGGEQHGCLGRDRRRGRGRQLATDLDQLDDGVVDAEGATQARREAADRDVRAGETHALGALESPRATPMTCCDAGPTQCPAQARQPEAGVGDHRDGAGPPGGVENGGQVGAGGTSRATRSCGWTPIAVSPADEVTHRVVQLAPGDRA